MISSTSAVLKTERFVHKDVHYTAAAYVDPGRPDEIQVGVVTDGKPVFVKLPETLATLEYSVSMTIDLSMKMTMGISGVDLLMETAEKDIIRLV